MWYEPKTKNANTFNCIKLLTPIDLKRNYVEESIHIMIRDNEIIQVTNGPIFWDYKRWKEINVLKKLDKAERLIYTKISKDKLEEVYRKHILSIKNNDTVKDY